MTGVQTCALPIFQLTFGPRYGLTIQSEPDAGTTVSIRLPALGEAEVRRERREQP